MVGWHHRLSGHEFGSALGVDDGQGGLACCSSWSHKESDMIGRLNNNSKAKVKLLTVQSTKEKIFERWKIFTKKYKRLKNVKKNK